MDAETNSIPVARTEAALSELTDCINHKDKEGFAKMALDGKVMFIDANTPVRQIGLVVCSIPAAGSVSCLVSSTRTRVGCQASG